MQIFARESVNVLLDLSSGAGTTYGDTLTSGAAACETGPQTSAMMLRATRAHVYDSLKKMKENLELLLHLLLTTTQSAAAVQDASTSSAP